MFRGLFNKSRDEIAHSFMDMEAALNADFSEAALDGISLDADMMNEDLHASAEYRAHLCVVMAKRAVSQLS